MLATPKMPKLLTYSNVDNNSDFDNNNSSICQESPPFSELEFHTSSDIKTREGRRFSSFQRQTQFPPWGIPSSGSTNPAGARMTTTTTMPPLMEIGHLYPIVTDLSDVEFQQSNAEISSNLNARCLSTFTTIVSQPQPRNKDGTTTSISGAANSSSSNSSSMTPSFWRGGRDWKRRRSARHTNNNRDDDGTRRHHTRSSSEGAATLLLESSNSFHLDDENNNDYVEEKEVKEKNNTSSSSFDDQYVLTRSVSRNGDAVILLEY